MIEGNNRSMRKSLYKMKMKGRSLWWVLAGVAVLALYFLVFRPREAVDSATIPPVQDGQQQEQATPDLEDRLPRPAGEGPGAAEAGEGVQLRRDLEFIARAFPILSSWDATAIKLLLSPATLEGSTDAQLNAVMGALGERLGTLLSFEQPVPTLTADSQQSTDRSGRLKHYEFVASYQNGVADVDLVLHQQPDATSLYSFNINVP